MLTGKIMTALPTHEGISQQYPPCLHYPPLIRRLLDWIIAQPLSTLSPGRYTLPFLPEKQAWFVILHYDTTDASLQKPEIHTHFCDLQIVLSGQERMAWCLDEGQFVPDGEYLPERDILYYQAKSDELNLFIAKPGAFYFFPPSFIHATNIQVTKPESVKKLVVKLHYSLFEEVS
ncbi:YhcH/YjgK/YiaL family protein [uncultured Cedecea sp.]|uniref:YhcH/YjgK/YiaL family protein n=1 Tax=uncultured Cedecea sp. TaxID=988762 RepID=UPI002616126B|nr:YhcH/YjgK/YiaL family protein [uncultured Cedecea sp.]